jgi:hypothetical protein
MFQNGEFFAIRRDRLISPPGRVCGRNFKPPSSESYPTVYPVKFKLFF